MSRREEIIRSHDKTNALFTAREEALRQSQSFQQFRGDIEEVRTFLQFSRICHARMFHVTLQKWLQYSAKTDDAVSSFLHKLVITIVSEYSVLVLLAEMVEWSYNFNW